MSTPSSMTLVQPYDSDMKAAIELCEYFQMRVSSDPRIDRGRLDNEIVEKFAAIDLHVTVTWEREVGPDDDQSARIYDPVRNPTDVLFPSIEVQGRIIRKGGEFDHAQMAHEVTHDVLGLGEADSHVIKTGGSAEAAMIRATEQSHRKAHGHGEAEDADGHRH